MPEQTPAKASNLVHVHIGDEDLGVFDFEKVTVFDAIQIKAKSGLTTKQFVDGLTEMDGTALQALVWLLRQRKGQATELRAINFAIGDLRMEDEVEHDPTTGTDVPVDPTSETSGSADAATSVSSLTSAI